jgi:acyl-coenzyme A synthetase/AMP-(fatty) acid ligase
LRQRAASAPADRYFRDRTNAIRVADLSQGTALGGRLDALAGRSVLLMTPDQMTAALALTELHGVARRITIIPPGSDPDHLPAIATLAEADAVVGTHACSAALGISLQVDCHPALVPASALPAAQYDTEWVMLTSGTTGVPKLAVHKMSALTAAIGPANSNAVPPVWGTFYDIRRYGGLQIFLRAVLGAASLVCSEAGEPVADYLARLGRHGVTHLSGTPSHWRHALMSPAIGSISPGYVRLSGEIADQGILDALKKAFPAAAIGHAYASTEAGVAFAVNDGRAGFPAHFVDNTHDGVDMRVTDGSLRIRSARTAEKYLGEEPPLRDDEGFVETGDMVERRGDRYFFVGRRGGIINVGGLKVHPEEIEAVINRHPRVQMSLVRPKRSPVTGAVVIADVVLRQHEENGGDDARSIKNDILARCRAQLPRHKVPAAISIVPALDVAATGKIQRRHNQGHG